jgi:hypothetical protein
MSQEYENADDFRKVFVSRLPLKWKDEMLKQHFESCFGGVEAASINWDKEGDFSLGYGFVTFLNEDGAKAAIEQGSMHVQRKIVQIRPVLREDAAAGRGGGRDSGVCFLWQKRRCVKGDSCKFSHEGEGACIAVAEPYQGLARRKCLSFKSKGKCSKGDACHFLHIGKEKGPPSAPKVEAKGAAVTEDQNSDDDNEDDNEEKERKEEKDSSSNKPKGICHSFKKKGKCRKGDKCKFLHAAASTAADATAPGAGKRKRVDGSLLVKNRKKLLLQEGEGGGEGEQPAGAITTGHQYEEGDY